MKRTILFLIFLSFISSCNQDKIVYNGLGSSKIISKKQSELIFNKIKSFPNNTQLSIALLDGGKVKYIGIQRKNDTVSEIFNYNRVFEIGSLSKLFTSTILADFVIEKKLQLDDNINGYLDFPLKNNVKISFKQLANHTSGLPKMPNNLSYTDKRFKFREYNDEKIEDYLKNYLELSFFPGTNSSYSNIGAGILGYMLCIISNSNYENLLHKYVLQKFEMNSTSTNHKDVEPYLVKGINGRGSEASKSILASLTPAGGVLSTVEDLSKFALAQFNPINQELKLTRQKTYKINNKTDQGLAWRIENNTTGKLYCHNGKTKGYSSSIALDVDRKNGVIILANVATFRNDNKGTIEELCLSLLLN